MAEDNFHKTARSMIPYIALGFVFITTYFYIMLTDNSLSRSIIQSGASKFQMTLIGILLIIVGGVVAFIRYKLFIRPCYVRISEGSLVERTSFTGRMDVTNLAQIEDPRLEPSVLGWILGYSKISFLNREGLGAMAVNTKPRHIVADLKYTDAQKLIDLMIKTLGRIEKNKNPLAKEK